MKRLVLAYNPVSGHAAFKKKLDWIIKEFQKRSCIIIHLVQKRCRKGDYLQHYLDDFN